MRFIPPRLRAASDRASRAARRAKRNQLGPDQVAIGRQRDGPLDRALQLLDVSGPRMASELGPGVAREGDPLLGLGAGALQEVLPDQLDVLDPVA